MDIIKITVDIQSLVGMAKIADWGLKEVKVDEEDVRVTLCKKYSLEDSIPDTSQ